MSFHSWLSDSADICSDSGLHSIVVIPVGALHFYEGGKPLRGFWLNNAGPVDNPEFSDIMLASSATAEMLLAFESGAKAHLDRLKAEINHAEQKLRLRQQQLAAVEALVLAADDESDDEVA